MGRSEQIWHFWRPDGLSEQNLKIFANAISGPNILGQNLEILSEHIARIFGKFNMALSPIIGGPGNFLSQFTLAFGHLVFVRIRDSVGL